MRKTQIIQIKSASGVEVIIFVDKITHMYVTEQGKTMIRMVNEQGVLTESSLSEIMTLVYEANGID